MNIFKVKIVSVFLLSIFFFLQSSCCADVKQAVVVMDFKSIGSEQHLGEAVAEILRTELIDTQRFRVVERAQIDKALSELMFQQSGAIDENNVVEIGKFLGTDLIIIGSVVKIGSSYTINSRTIDIKTGEATSGKTVTGNDLNLLTNLSRSLIDKLFVKQVKLPQLPQQETVTAKISDTHGAEKGEEQKNAEQDFEEKIAIRLLSNYTIGIYFPDKSQKLRNTANDLRSKLIKYGLKGEKINIYPRDDAFFDKVVPPKGFEIRYEQGYEDAAAEALSNVLRKTHPSNIFHKQIVENRTANFISLFLGLKN